MIVLDRLIEIVQVGLKRHVRWRLKDFCEKIHTMAGIQFVHFKNGCIIRNNCNNDQHTVKNVN